MTLLWSLITTALGWLAEAPAWVWLCVGALGVGYGLGTWGLPWTGAEREGPRVVRDTVERQITKRDTVTETRPVRVTVYDTVRTTDIDTQYVPVPSSFNFEGMTSANPVRVQGQEFVLTEWLPSEQRFVQSTYEAERDHWAITTEGVLTAGFNLDERSLEKVSTKLTGGVEYRTRRWTTRVAGGVQTSITDTDLGMYGVGEVSVRYTAKSW